MAKKPKKPKKKATRPKLRSMIQRLRKARAGLEAVLRQEEREKALLEDVGRG